MKPSFAPESALDNHAAFARIDYPGRLVILGAIHGQEPGSTALVSFTAIGGRSFGSRNRTYEPQPDGRTIKTAYVQACDEDPSLTIYPAMCVGNAGYTHVASNGHQTLAIRDGLDEDRSHGEVIESWLYEPDPNATPRISGSIELLADKPPRMVMSSITKAPPGDYVKAADEAAITDAVRKTWSLPTVVGVGYMLRTYECNGDPIPSYLGDPVSIPLEGSLRHCMTTVWDAFNAQNRAAMCMRVIDSKTGSFRTFIKTGERDIVEV